MWFGHGTAGSKDQPSTGGSDPMFKPENLNKRIDAAAHGSLMHLPRKEWHRPVLSLDREPLERLRTAMTTWLGASGTRWRYAGCRLEQVAGIPARRRRSRRGLPAGQWAYCACASGDEHRHGRKPGARPGQHPPSTARSIGCRQPAPVGGAALGRHRDGTVSQHTPSERALPFNDPRHARIDRGEFYRVVE